MAKVIHKEEFYCKYCYTTHRYWTRRHPIHDASNPERVVLMCSKCNHYTYVGVEGE